MKISKYYGGGIIYSYVISVLAPGIQLQENFDIEDLKCAKILPATLYIFPLFALRKLWKKPLF